MCPARYQKITGFDQETRTRLIDYIIRQRVHVSMANAEFYRQLTKARGLGQEWLRDHGKKAQADLAT
jgi:hypothetical protein